MASFDSKNNLSCRYNVGAGCESRTAKKDYSAREKGIHLLNTATYKMNTEALILNYWKSWQSHSNWEETRALMKDDFYFDAGFFKTESADQLIEMMKNGNPWQDVQLLDIVTHDDKGALFYEGIDTVTQSRVRIAEIITVEAGKVASCVATISQMTQEDA
ncbi:MAG: nuclear transport factor 2 family protein [Bacteroidia bacterium]